MKIDLYPETLIWFPNTNVHTACMHAGGGGDRISFLCLVRTLADLFHSLVNPPTSCQLLHMKRRNWIKAQSPQPGRRTAAPAAMVKHVAVLLRPARKCVSYAQMVSKYAGVTKPSLHSLHSARGYCHVIILPNLPIRRTNWQCGSFWLVWIQPSDSDEDQNNWGETSLSRWSRPAYEWTLARSVCGINAIWRWSEPSAPSIVHCWSKTASLACSAVHYYRYRVILTVLPTPSDPTRCSSWKCFQMCHFSPVFLEKQAPIRITRRRKFCWSV